MLIHIVDFPTRPSSKPILKSDYPATTRGKELYDALKKHKITDVKLIIDNSVRFKRITQDDAVCRYYRGQPGDIFRICRNNGSIDYRAVVRALPLTTAASKSKIIAKEATALLYYQAFDTIITMLQDRQHEHDRAETDKLRISRDNMEQIIINSNYSLLNIDAIPNKKGQYMYVRFIDRMFDAAPVKLAKTVDEIKGVVGSAHKTRYPDGQDYDLIVVFNNQKGLPMPDPDPDHLQTFSVQQLSFNVTKHKEQPEFTLLDITVDRDEIRDQYMQNGRVLEEGDTLEERGIKEGTRLIAI